VYIADGEGQIRYHHFGEGEYPMTEMVIQQLLRDAGVGDPPADLASVEPRGLEVAADWSSVRSGETYLGYGQASGLVARVAYDRSHDYVISPRLTLNTWDLSGRWTVAQHASVLDAPMGRIGFQFHARDVNLVMGPVKAGDSIPFRVLLDGEAPRGALGTDLAADGHGVVAHQQTYQLIRQPGPVVERRFEIEFLAPGVEAYCFTFG
jgi:hypothetical protein